MVKRQLLAGTLGYLSGVGIDDAYKSFAPYATLVPIRRSARRSPICVGVKRDAHPRRYAGNTLSQRRGQVVRLLIVTMPLL